MGADSLWHWIIVLVIVLLLFRSLGLRGILLQIGELQLELIQQRSALRGLPELLVPQLLDRELFKSQR